MVSIFCLNQLLINSNGWTSFLRLNYVDFYPVHYCCTIFVNSEIMVFTLGSFRVIKFRKTHFLDKHSIFLWWGIFGALSYSQHHLYVLLFDDSQEIIVILVKDVDWLMYLMIAVPLLFRFWPPQLSQNK